MAQGLNTSRLLLRQWKAEDYVDFRKMGADPEVMEFFPSLLSGEESDAMADKIHALIESKGWGMWAIEEKSTGRFVGFTGLHEPDRDLPFTPCVEVGWRLAKSFWGKGYATEAARVALQFGFETLNLDSIVAFTTVNNLKSQAVMKRLNMHNTGENFMHPTIDRDHPLCEHVLYRISRSEWLSNGG